MTEQNPIIYLGWQNPLSRRWFVVGRLRLLPNSLYEFIYTRGYEDAQRISNMQPILGFMDKNRRYLSPKLFPLFQNRLMSPNREEYAHHIAQLGLAQESGPPLAPLQILARSGGRRATDSFEVFPSPSKQQQEDGRHAYVVSFFVRGIRYLPVEARLRASSCKSGERLLILSDWQNEHDKNSTMLRTEKDNYLLGWLPRYYSADIASLRAIEVKVERANPPSTPVDQQLLCRLTAPWPEDFRAFSSSEYEPLIDIDSGHEDASSSL